MKRFAWLWIAVFCLAVAQVQPVEPAAKAQAKSCCDCGGRCGMPACPLPVASAPSVFDAARPITVARPERTRENPAVRRVRETFFVSFLHPAARAAVAPAPVLARAASVPLFQAHCSFLI